MREIKGGRNNEKGMEEGGEYMYMYVCVCGGGGIEERGREERG